MFSGRYFQSILNLNLKLEELELPPPNIFSLNSTGRLFSAASEGYDNSDCCPPVVDPYTLLALLAGIALAAYFLRLALVKKCATVTCTGRSWPDGFTFNDLLNGLASGRRKILTCT